jgi:hypothetical protein
VAEIEEIEEVAEAEEEEEAAPTEVPPVEEAEEEEEEPEEAPPAPAAEGFMADIMDSLREILGMEIGSVTIGGKTWSKAILQPQFALGKLKVGLYLPIIYEKDLFDPNDWYWPEGNNEWSFGSDQTETWPMIQDIANDLFLKIRYIEWGKLRDPFFFKIGNLQNLTVGHGMIMRDYWNNTEFPTVRRIGVNLGMYGNVAGFEAVVNDIVDPAIFGGRVFLRPFGKFFPAIGLSLIADWDPAGEAEADTTELGAPMLFNGGLDLDLPIVEFDPFSIILFADAAAMIPLFISRARHVD